MQQQGIEIRSHVSGVLPGFRADRAQVEQVLLNLMLNASEAMPKGGQLRISGEPRKSGGKTAHRAGPAR